MSQILCITGMHRSGTSLITSWLESSGLVTHDGSFHGPSVGNEKGNFEDKDFVDTHIKELKSRYPDSKGWQVFIHDQLSFSSENRVHISNLIKSRSTKYPIWGWKDPRSVFFLEDWKSLIPNLKVLFLWRPCGEVVRSLVTRSTKAQFDVFKVGREESVLMWITYNALILNYLRKHPRDSILLSTRDIIANTRPSFARINKFLGNKLSYSDFANTFDAKLFSGESICENDYAGHTESVESLHFELRSLSEK